jgi:hypothetical protein
MNYDYPSLENQKWIIKDVGTCEQTAGYPAPYIQHAPAQTVSPCNSRNIIMNRRSGGLANRFRNYEGNEKGTSKLPLFVFYLIGAGALYYVARKNKWLED